MRKKVRLMNFLIKWKLKIKEKKEKKQELKRLEKEFRESEMNQMDSEQNIKRVNKCKIM